MHDFLEKLRKKPKHVRSQYAFWTALVFTLLIATVWVIQVPGKLLKENTQVAAVATVEAHESSFSKTFSKTIQGAKTYLQNIGKNAEYVRVQTEEEYRAENIIDLNALVASSSKAKQMKANNTEVSTTSTSTPTITNADSEGQ
ncbi:MAG: hypothetical protein RI911_416 [Candidatus Parcubacteria bacterium]|jgi:hypothetical protein